MINMNQNLQLPRSELDSWALNKSFKLIIYIRMATWDIYQLYKNEWWGEMRGDHLLFKKGFNAYIEINHSLSAEERLNFEDVQSVNQDCSTAVEVLRAIFWAVGDGPGSGEGWMWPILKWADEDWAKTQQETTS